MEPVIPAHVAIIMDGNGRWAAKRLMPRSVGHKKGVESVRRVVKAAAKAGVAALTLYAFSVENWKRPKDEVDSLMSLFVRSIDNELDDLVSNGIRLRFIGIREGLPADVAEKVSKAEEKTADGEALLVNVALNYSARSEIAAVFRALAEDISHTGHVTEQSISDALFTSHCGDPDLIIRTGGEHRLSNFLLWQAAYSELYFTDVLWPDFSEDDFNAALEDYSQRERRYGGIK